MTDITTDPALDTIALLASAAVKGDLGDANIVGLFKQPTTLATAGMSKLPALAIYIESEKQNRRHSAALDDNLIVVFEYIRSATQASTRDTTYPPLRHVWRSIRNVLEAGSYATVSAGADVMEAASLQVDESTPDVKYGFMGSENYPFFQGRMMIMSTPAEANFSALDDFLIHATLWTLPEGEEYDTNFDDTTNLLGTQKLEGTIPGSAELTGTLTDA